MALPNVSIPKVKTVNRDLEAWLRLPALENDDQYTLEYLHEVLKLNQVTYGIDEEQLKEILDKELYEQDILVAKGCPQVDGQDGYYEYKVNMNLEKKPRILEDGSVDYWSMYSVQSVQKDQVIAIYHPAVKGTDGTAVTGRPILARIAREQPALRGTGFGRSEDYLTYFSLMDGKIDIKDGKIMIRPIYEMSGDANLTTGNVDFTGDIVIHGNVATGVKIKATGSITVDGVVEACDLEAGKDIILRKGMIGGNKAHVKTKGTLYAKFIEYTSIEADGDIEASVLLDCNVFCKGKIVVQGKSAKIIGGDVHAVQGITATTIGNEAELRTNITVGVGKNSISRSNLLKRKVEITKQELEKIEEALKKFEDMEKERGVSYKEDPRRVALLRTRIKDTATIAEDEAEIKKLERLIASGAHATISATREVFPGVAVMMREQILAVKNYANNVEFYYFDDKIRTRAAVD